MFFYNVFLLDTVVDPNYYYEIKFERFRKHLRGGELFANNIACSNYIWVFKVARVANIKLSIKG